MTHQPTFAERIEELEANIHMAQDIIESHRAQGRETSHLTEDIAEYRQELAEVRAEQAVYNARVI